MDRWRWNGGAEEEVQGICRHMERHAPRSPNSTGTSYEDIARKWLNQIPVEVLKKRRFTKNQLGHQLSLTDVKRAFNHRYTKNGKKHYWLYWFARYYPLWTEVTKGSNITGKVSQVMIEFDILEALKNADGADILAAWQQEVKNIKATGDQDYHCDDILIDLDNLQRYIYNTEDELQYKTGGERNQMKINLSEANVIEALTIAYNKSETDDRTGKTYWYVPQLYYEHPQLSRRYYVTSISLQMMHSKLREVIVGPGWSIDINTSVYSFYKLIASEMGINSAIITEMMEDKQGFRQSIADVLLNTYTNRRIDKAKRAITAMGFGAKNLSFGAVADIIRDPEDVKAFNRHPKILELKRFMTEVVNFVKSEFQAEIKNLGPEYRHGRGYNYKKFLSWMYHNYETDVMRELIEDLDSQRVYTVLWVHDGLYVRDRFDGVSLQYTLQQTNRFATLEITEIKPWRAVRRTEWQTEQQRHREFIAAEEVAAQAAAGKQISEDQILDRFERRQKLHQENPGHYTGSSDIDPEYWDNYYEEFAPEYMDKE